MPKKPPLLIASILLMSAGSAAAQASPQRAAPPAPNPLQKCAPLEKGAQPGTAPQGETIGRAREPLGEKLARSGGVLCPPAGVDPEMRAPPPDAGRTPVIRPPGSPGGDPSVRPK